MGKWRRGYGGSGEEAGGGEGLGGVEVKNLLNYKWEKKLERQFYAVLIPPCRFPKKYKLIFKSILNQYFINYENSFSVNFFFFPRYCIQ